MTRQEFIDDVNSWSELINFCNEYGCDECSDVYDESQRDESIDNSLEERARDCNEWRELYSYLNAIPSGYDYYSYDYDYDEWKGLDDDDFDDYKDEVLDWADDNDIFEEEYTEEYEDADDECEEDVEEDELEDEDISLGELFNTCNNTLQELNENTNANPLEDMYIEINDPIPF